MQNFDELPPGWLAYRDDQNQLDRIILCTERIATALEKIVAAIDEERNRNGNSE
jgi:hypothetical protein